MNEKDILNRWKHASIHLEGATDSVSIDRRLKQIEELTARHRAGQISDREFAEALSGGFRDVRYQGTAVFLEHNNRRYLITARHVLFDERAAKARLERTQEDSNRSPSMGAFLLESEKQYAELSIYPIIFRVPGLDELVQERTAIGEFLMNLGAGVPELTPYTFSPPLLDLAIISLDQRNAKFADELISLGYSPISLDDIGEEPSAEGADIFAVGFPRSTAVLGEIPRDMASWFWSSSNVSVPIFAFGKVSMLHSQLHFFWCDLSIYPGNSGGPVIENGKLVGIVSKQATIHNETAGKEDRMS